MIIANEKNAKNLSGRPMGINKIEYDGTMWFFTKASSYKAKEIETSKKFLLLSQTKAVKTI